MSKPAMHSSPAAFQERAVTLAVESEQPMAQTARDLGVHENTFHPWSGNYPRVERQDKPVQDAPRSEDLQRLRQATSRLPEGREI